VPAQAGTVSSASVMKNNALMTDLFKFGLRSKVKRLGSYAGSFLALGAPLILDWGSPNDGINGFVSGDYSEATGLAGGTSKYIETGLNPVLAGASATSWHMGCYIRTGSDAATHAMGGQDPGQDTALLVSFSGTSYWDSNNFTTGRCSVADSAGTGLYIGSRTSASASNLYKNGTSIASTAGAAGVLPGVSMAVHAFHDSATGFISWNARTYALYTFGSGLTAGDVTNYYLAVQRYQTSFARQV